MLKKVVADIGTRLRPTQLLSTSSHGASTRGKARCAPTECALAAAVYGADSRASICSRSPSSPWLPGQPVPSSLLPRWLSAPPALPRHHPFPLRKWRPSPCKAGLRRSPAKSEFEQGSSLTCARHRTHVLYSALCSPQGRLQSRILNVRVDLQRRYRPRGDDQRQSRTLLHSERCVGFRV